MGIMNILNGNNLRMVEPENARWTDVWFIKQLRVMIHRETINCKSLKNITCSYKTKDIATFFVKDRTCTNTK